MKKCYLTLLLSLFLLTTIGHNNWAQSRITTSAYIDTYKDWAIQDMKVSGIPASIKLAQGILESGSGNSKLAREDNNHFGIKCHADWKGKRVYHHDDARNECFRKYGNPFESFSDHTDFLVLRDRYSSLFHLATTDYKGWAHGLKKAGYATNPSYAHLLIKVIEDNELYKYDADISERARKSNRETQRRSGTGSLVVNPFDVRSTSYNNGVKYVVLEEDDNLQSISQMYGLKSWELPSYNDLSNNADISKYKILYLEAKQRNAHPDHTKHLVREGETMHQISQQYGMKLSRLYYLNRMQKGSEPKVGDRLELRRRVRK
ncbi:MAG TPA: glucosaminidase domain-containing protein [Marinilabiliaceae bacterium]|nr:glucosaminidase domain-containing protein [Marinilabiliaceae bacterium]